MFGNEYFTLPHDADSLYGIDGEILRSDLMDLLVEMYECIMRCVAKSSNKYGKNSPDSNVGQETTELNEFQIVLPNAATNVVMPPKWWWASVYVRFSLNNLFSFLFFLCIGCALHN